ncbi:MAG: hypothetical protein FWC07_12400, partial [Defluviitaleaceae bacterium]|nr:hypothetical protein [Defluviitaleaceae bacterium]
PPATPPPGEDPAGVYTPSGQTPADETRGLPDRARMEQLWNHHHQQVESFRRMMEALFNRQAQEHGIAVGDWNPQDVPLTDEMRAAAQEQIDEGGYFSVEETARRILDFAVAISGGDPERLEVLRGAIEQAFENAERIWGGELPEISQQTRAAVMEGLDQWAANGDPRDILLLNPAAQGA